VIDMESNGYFPVIIFDDFWILKENMIQLNETVKTVPLQMNYSPISLMKWTLFMQVEQSLLMQQQMGTSAEDESDEFKVRFAF